VIEMVEERLVKVEETTLPPLAARALPTSDAMDALLCEV
jgi:hypothetical protein